MNLASLCTDYESANGKRSLICHSQGQRSQVDRARINMKLKPDQLHESYGEVKTLLNPFGPGVIREVDEGIPGRPA